MSDDAPIVTVEQTDVQDDPPDLATTSSVGANCHRCGLWVPANDSDAVIAEMAAHMVQHYGPWA